MTESIQRGFSLMSTLIVLGVVGLLSTIAYPSYLDYVDRARTAQAIADIGRISLAVERFRAGSVTDSLPVTLEDIGYGDMLDPWGNPYAFLNIGTVDGNGPLRKDHERVPINSDYDLYSMGKDGSTETPLTSTHGRDDVVRGLNGSFLGAAKDFSRNPGNGG